jgi:glycosyltransferase involved in cell wall biosynthesis
VLPIHDGARYLAGTIESVLAQTLASWELILVDDASTDATPALAAEFSARDPRIRCVTHETNRGLPAALNSGFAEARGELFSWTSDDNLYRPNAFEIMEGFLRANAGVDLVYADATAIDAEGRPLGPMPAGEVEDLPFGNQVGACFLYRRRVHEALGGYDERRFLVEDYDFWLRAAARFRIAPLHRDLYQFRFHSSSLTETRRAEVLRLLRETLTEHLPALTWLTPEARGRAEAWLRALPELEPAISRAEQHRRWSSWALFSGNAATSRHHALAALRCAPLEIASWRAVARALGLRRSRAKRLLEAH